MRGESARAEGLSMAQIGDLDFEAFVQKKKGERAGGGDEGGHAYAYVSDRTMRAGFDKVKPVELAVAAAVRMFKSVGKNKLLGQAVKVGPRQFPRVHDVAVDCARSLGIAAPTV